MLRRENNYSNQKSFAMQKITDTILRLPYTLSNVDKLADLINDAKRDAEKNAPLYSNDFLGYLQNHLGKEVEQLISDKRKYMNTSHESFIIASFMTLKMGIHHFLSNHRKGKVSNMSFLL